MKGVLVTGASGGIGRAIVRRLAEDGYAVVAHYHRNEPTELRSDKVELVQADLTTTEGCLYAFEFASTRGIPFWGLVNNAAIRRATSLAKQTPAAVDEMLALNLRAPALLTGFAAHHKNAAGNGGRIINITSVAGEAGYPGVAGYCATKAGIIGLTKATAVELAKKEITCNAVSPGLVFEGMGATLPPDVREQMLKSVPLGRAVEPSEIADLVAFLVSEKAAAITGQIIPINGGLRT